MKLLIQIAILAGLVWFLWLGGLERKMSADYAAQYRLAKDSGDQMQVCAAASVVALSYLQANDREGYLRWKATEELECKIARRKTGSR